MFVNWLVRLMYCLCFIFAVFNYSVAEEQSQLKLIIRNINVVNTETGVIDRKQTVVVKNGVISAVQNTAGKQNISGSLVIDGSDKYLIPGLIDGHVHVSSTLGMSLLQEKQYPDLVEQYRQQLPMSYLYFGFTSLVDLSSLPGRLNGFRKHVIRPELYDCGSALALEDGYPAIFLPKKERLQILQNIIFNPESKEHLSGISAEKHVIPEAIKRVKNSGAICVKSFHEDGFGKSIWSVPSQQMLKQMASEAHNKNLQFLLHANSINAYKAVIDTGVDIIVHGLWNWDEYKGKPGVPSEIKAVLNEIILKDIGIMPTLRVVAGNHELFNKNFLKNPKLTSVLPTAYLDWLKSPKANWFKASLLKRLKMSESVVAEKQREAIDEGERAFQYLYKRGGRILFGTDTPASPSYGNVPGLNGYFEIKAMARAGMALKDILASATIHNAKAFGLEDKLGTVAVGKTANLLVLNENPLKTVEAYNQIDQVILKGKAYKRESFAAN